MEKFRSSTQVAISNVNFSELLAILCPNFFINTHSAFFIVFFQKKTSYVHKMRTKFSLISERARYLSQKKIAQFGNEKARIFSFHIRQRLKFFEFPENNLFSLFCKYFAHCFLQEEFYFWKLTMWSVPYTIHFWKWCNETCPLHRLSSLINESPEQLSFGVFAISWNPRQKINCICYKLKLHNFSIRFIFG